MFLRVVRAAGGKGVKHEYVRVVEALRAAATARTALALFGCMQATRSATWTLPLTALCLSQPTDMHGDCARPIIKLGHVCGR